MSSSVTLFCMFIIPQVILQSSCIKSQFVLNIIPFQVSLLKVLLGIILLLEVDFLQLYIEPYQCKDNVFFSYGFIFCFSFVYLN